MLSRFYRLTNATIYNASDEAISRKCTGVLVEKKTHNSFDTSLHLSTPKFVQLKPGESYYAVGTDQDGGPVRTETVKCTVPGRNPIFEGSVPFFETPKDFKAPSEAESDADMFVQFTNYSSLQINNNGYGFNLQTGFGYPTNTPGPILIPHSGQQSIGAGQRLAWFAEGPANIWCYWVNNGGASLFGVWIHFNYQMFRLGPRPIWYVFSHGWDNWQLAGADPSDPFTWPSNLGFNVAGTPTSGANSLSINVIITDPAG